MYHFLSFEATGITEEEGGGEKVRTMIVLNFSKEQNHLMGFLIPHCVNLKMFM